jgi:hypothetical protein
MSRNRTRSVGDSIGALLIAVVLVALLCVSYLIDTAHAAPVPDEPADGSSQVQERTPVGPLRGCHGKYRLQVSDWNQRTELEILRSPDPFPEPVYIYHDAYLHYYRCPNLNGPHKAMPVGVEVCHIMGRANLSRQYDYTKYDIYVYDSSGKDINGSRFNVREGPREDRYYKCGYYHIPLDRRKWMKKRDFPRWNMRSLDVTETRIPDNPWRNWHTPSSEVRYLDFTGDLALGGWRVPT